MEQIQRISRPLKRGDIHLDIYNVGEDICAVLYGGEKPHIGCAVVAVPRPSLMGDGAVSTTSSVINITGHKDEYICRKTAEWLCREFGVTVTCTGGFHSDSMIKEDIDEVMRSAEEMLTEVKRATNA